MEPMPDAFDDEAQPPEYMKDRRLTRQRTNTNLAASRHKTQPGQLPRLLQDPLGDRAVSEVPRPVAELLVGDSLWDVDGLPRLDVLDNHLWAEGLLCQELMLELIARAQEKFLEEPNMLMVQDPVTVVGDIHGQFYDLRTLIEVGGDINNTQYLFLGDYVDRGSFSVEVTTFLFAVKLRYPKSCLMLRGNHESRQMTNFFNFHEEVEFKYDNVVFDAIMEAFDAMPIAALINGQFLAVHGGISPDMARFRNINSLSRVQETPRSGPLCDLLWSDPCDEARAMAWAPNANRGCAYHFSMNSAFKFLSDNRLLSIFRAHEVQKEGFKFHRSNPKSHMPGVITIFSAPNYCDAYGNRGAVMRLDNNTLNLKQYNFVNHPYHLTNFMSVFEWSLPFVAEQVLAVFHSILEHTDADADGAKATTADASNVDAARSRAENERTRRPSLSIEEGQAINFALGLSDGLKELSPADEKQSEHDDHRKRLQLKVRAVARMAKLCRETCEKRKSIISLRGVCPGDRFDAEQLMERQDTVKTERQLFELAQDLDCKNERRPEGEEAAAITAE